MSRRLPVGFDAEFRRPPPDFKTQEKKYEMHTVYPASGDCDEPGA